MMECARKTEVGNSLGDFFPPVPVPSPVCCPHWKLETLEDRPPAGSTTKMS